jgi:transposase
MESVLELKETIAAKDARIAELEAKIQYYEEQILLAKKRQFGVSSEKGVPEDQLGLFDEVENTADPSEPEPTMEQITYTRKKRVGKREADLSALPQEVIEYELPEDERICPTCGGDLHVMGHETRDELKIIPAQIVAVRHRVAVYSCRGCEHDDVSVPIIKAKAPEPFIKNSIASPSLVAHIMTQKYVMHSPLYRQEQDWRRQDISLSRQTMANWVNRSAEEWLKPIYDKLVEGLLEHQILHADETPCQVLHEPDKKATAKSYMWLYRTSGESLRPTIVYEYQPSRSHVHPERFLKTFRGYLHADGFPGYHKLPPEITIVGCWVHLRRKFQDALKILPKESRESSLASEANEKISFLFHLEDIWKGLPPDDRLHKRLEESRPLAEAFFNWLEQLKILPKSTLGGAVHYALTQKKWLMNVYLDGRTEISNNRVENSVRPFAIGRKNWLFMNTVKGAEASSVIYSIIETAKANGLKPFEYLEFLLTTVPFTTTGALESLLPWGGAVPSRCRISVLEK